VINYFDVFFQLIYSVTILILHYILINFSHFGLNFVDNEKEKKKILKELF